MHKKTASLALTCFLLLASVGLLLLERVPSVEGTLLQTASAQQSEVKWIPNLDHMIVASIDEPETSDPTWAYDTASAEMIFNVYETLIFWPYEGVPSAEEDFQLMLADEVIIPTGSNPPGLTYPGIHPDAPAGTVETWYFKIRPNVPYHDPAYGTVTPADVEYSIERVMVFDHRGGPAWMHYFPLLSLSGSLDWDTDEDGKLSYDEAAVGGPLIDGAVESNETHVWFNLAVSYPPLIQILAQTWSSVYPQAWGIDLYDEGRFFWPGWDYVTPGRPGATPYDSWADFNDHTHTQVTAPADQLGETKMMGTGPYKFDYWVKGDTYQLLKFDDYWRGWPGSGEADYVEIFTHKLVESWTARRDMFLSELEDKQADIVDVPRVYIGQVETEPGVRGVKDLPSLLLSPAMCFNYNVSKDAIYFTTKPKLGADEKPDLFSDKHMRKAFAHALDYDEYLVDAFLGEAFQPATPIVNGLAQYNATKEKMHYSLDLVKAELQLAWAGINGLGTNAWTEGFYVPLTYNRGNEARRIACEMIAASIEILGTKYQVEVFSLPWREAFVPAMRRSELTVSLVEKLADYADADDFIVPFMHSTIGTFANHQSIDFSDFEPSDFAPNSGRVDSAGNYRNWEGKVWSLDTFNLNNSYVDGLIERATTETPANRLAIYSELEDIYYAACASIPVAQPLVRHWERDWVQGWYYNPMHPGLYVYHLWKGLDADITGDGRVTIADFFVLNRYFFNAFWDPIRNQWVIISGPAGIYNRIADISSPFVTGGLPRTWELDGTEFVWKHYGLIAGYEIPGVDGLVNLFDQALITAHLGQEIFGVPPPPPPSPGPSTLAVYPSEISATEPFSIDITIDQAEAMLAFQFELKYDTNILTATSYGSYYPFWFDYSYGINDQQGYVSICYSMSIPEVIGFYGIDCPIAWIGFSVDAAGTSPLNIEKPVIFDIYGDATAPQVINGEYSTPPLEQMQSLVTTIESWNLPPGTENSLTLKLDAAIDLFKKDNINGAVHKLEDFIKSVEAQRTGKLTDEQADYLVARAQACINTILSMP